ncbi:hypothetical protein AYL99_04783 [Fonsecaea erecta]|uniref:Uncharacterized protein n=1 Tax=Fonsecaea erecta TaxID=1367422 RepID=A0A178ZJX4_9EURO|nr:hypothetical protein AYL99_04783 [Fonsecaea erecta]OAP59781.1 hypothetical protein AYL99_04783 [Fonsecaea erecta]
MGTGKRPGEGIAIPIASKIQRISDDPAGDAPLQPGQDIQVLNRKQFNLPSPPPTQFHLKIRISSEKNAVKNDHTSPAHVDGVALDIEYLDSNTAKCDEFSHLSWLEPMEVLVTTGGSSPDQPMEKVGFCRAKLIRREMIRGTFYQTMSKPFDESALLAFDLFDRFGMPKDDYENHAIRKGSCSWGPLLDDGDILLIEDIIIEKPHRRLGLGSKVVAALLETTNKRTTIDSFVAILWPESSKEVHFEDLLAAIVGDSGNNRRPEVFDHHDSVAIAWTRSLGFKRIGSSIWFGLPSWCGDSQAAELDNDPPGFERATQDTLPNSIRGQVGDTEFLKATQQYLQQIKPDSQPWFATDKEANTLLHLAALDFLPESVAWIMQQPAAAHLIALRNSSGNTPLEALLQKLEIVRTRSLSGTSITILSDDFNGHTLSMARCTALLKGVKIDTDKDLEQFRYGCTCGVCKDGYLSVRMRLALCFSAKMLFEHLDEDPNHQPGTEWVDYNASIFSHLPSYCIRLLSRYRAAREGGMRLCNHIACCVHDACNVPNETTIDFIVETKEDKPNFIEKFFRCGGSIQALMRCVFQMAVQADDMYGDGSVQDWDEGRIYRDLEPCRNDHEFVLVARKCGYESHRLIMDCSS